GDGKLVGPLADKADVDVHAGPLVQARDDEVVQTLPTLAMDKNDAVARTERSNGPLLHVRAGCPAYYDVHLVVLDKAGTPAALAEEFDRSGAPDVQVRARGVTGRALGAVDGEYGSVTFVIRPQQTFEQVER